MKTWFHGTAAFLVPNVGRIMDARGYMGAQPLMLYSLILDEDWMTGARQVISL